MVASTTANISQSRGEDGGRQRKGSSSNGIGASEKAKASNLCRQLQMRLQYAKLKVEHGWQKQSINEVENLYFHLSHTRPKTSRVTPQPSMVVTNPSMAVEVVPPLAAGPSGGTTFYGETAADRRSTLSYLARNGLSTTSEDPIEFLAQTHSGPSTLGAQITPASATLIPGSSAIPNFILGQNTSFLSHSTHAQEHTGVAISPDQTSNPQPLPNNFNAPPHTPPAQTSALSPYPIVLAPPPDPPTQDSTQPALLLPPQRLLGRPPSTQTIIPPGFVNTFGIYTTPPTPPSEPNDPAGAGGEKVSPSKRNAKRKGKAKESSPITNNAGTTSPLQRLNSSSLSFIPGGTGGSAMTYDAFWSNHGTSTSRVIPSMPTSATAMVSNGPNTVGGVVPSA